MIGHVSVVLDSQAGSCGKGKFIGYIAEQYGDTEFVGINNFMSNAGHTFECEDGRRVMTQHLPTSMMNPNAILMIGPGAAITPSILFNEIIGFKDILDGRKVYIHPRAMVILPEHAEKEKELVRSGSTFKGCGVAQADKIMRVPGTKLFGEWYQYTDWASEVDGAENMKLVLDTIEIEDTMVMLNNMLDCGTDVLVEGSQGCDLDINYGLEYPHTTSRQCHVGQLTADCGISPRLVGDIIMVMRPYPIRISNSTNIGIEVSSGDYDGAEELTWDEIKSRCGAPDDVEFGEQTTVTKKTRRVFEMNWDRLKYVVALNRPTQIAINFVQYIDWDAYHCTKYSELPVAVLDFIAKVEAETGTKVTMIGTGAGNQHIIHR